MFTSPSQYPSNSLANYNNPEYQYNFHNTKNKTQSYNTNNQYTYPSNHYNGNQNVKQNTSDPFSTYAKKHHENNQGFINNNSSFLDKFDNNNSFVLNHEKSHARNLRGRLFNNNEPLAEQAKEDRMRAYRQDLQKQMKADQ